MHEGLYTTVAQTIPVFLLALLWESAYLDRLRAEHQPPRGSGTRGRFWTKPRIRVCLHAIADLAGSVRDPVFLDAPSRFPTRCASTASWR